MGKSLIKIIEGLALQVAAPTIGSLIGGPFGVAVAKALTASGGSLILSGAVSGIASALAKTPKPATAETAIKVPIPPRVSAYGEVRLQGAQILYDTAPNGWAVDAYVFHDGRVASIGDKYIGDRKVSLLSGGWVLHQENGLFGKNNDCVQIETRLGLPTETAFGSLIYNIPDHWTVDHRGDGCVTGSMISKNVKVKDFPEVYATGGPNQTSLSLSLRAQLVFDWRDVTQDVDDPDTWKWSPNAILHLVHYLLVRMGKTWALHFVPTLAYWTAAADVCDQAIPLKGVQTILAGKADEGDTSVNVYSTNGLATGMTIAIKLSGDNSQTETRVVTSISGAFVHFSGGLGHDHPQGSEVSWASDPGSPATEPRYRGCVVHSHTDQHKAVLAHLLDCCDGWLSPRSDGALVVFAGQYEEPTVTIGPDAIVSFSIQEGVEEEAALNSIKLSYVSAAHDFASVQTDDWTDEDDIAERGKILSDSLENQVPSHSQARRLGKRKLSKVMAPFRGNVVTTSKGRPVIGQRNIWLTIIEAGATFYDGPAEIAKLTRVMSNGGVSFDWIAADPNIDAWNPATEEGLPAPVGNRQSAPIILAPTVISAVYFGSDDSGTGTAGARIRITIAAQVRDDLTWFARWRVVGAAAWNEQQYTDVDGTALVVLETSFVPVGADIEVEAAYQTGNGIVSPWSTPSTEVGTGTTHFDDTTTTFDSINVRWDRT